MPHKENSNDSSRVLKKTQILIVTFNQVIEAYMISKFRGAIANKMQPHLLFHNHENDGRLRYAYPLVQYKRVGNKAAIVCMGNSVETAFTLFQHDTINIEMQNKPYELQVDRIQIDNVLIQTVDKWFYYSIQNWIPLNKKNYDSYINYKNNMKREELLEKVLIGNLLSMAKGLDVHIKEQIKLKILTTNTPKTVTYKENKLLAFNVRFKSNLFIPNFIGLGKGVSLGYGTINMVKN